MICLFQKSVLRFVLSELEKISIFDCAFGRQKGKGAVTARLWREKFLENISGERGKLFVSIGSVENIWNK